MRCFPACFGHLRRNVTTEKVQHQCFSGSNEAVKLLPDKTESHKEEEIAATPIKFMIESKDKPQEKTNIHITNEETPVSNHSGVNECANELASTNSDMLLLNKNGEAQKEREKEKEKEKDEDTEANYENPLKQVHQDLLINDRECSSVEEDSMSSLFSLSIDSRKQFWGAEMGDKEVSSILKIKNTSSKLDEEKENVPLSNDPMMEQTFDKSKVMKSAAVETSLSTWLVESEKSPRKMSAGGSPESEKNYQDRQVLGVIAPPADVKKLNGYSSVGSTPCCSGDDQPGVGTVGQYWRRRGRIGEVADCRL